MTHNPSLNLLYSHISKPRFIFPYKPAYNMKKPFFSTSILSASFFSLRSHSNLPPPTLSDTMASLLRPPTCSTIPHLLDRNKIWARRTRLALPALFPRLAREQTPQILWIGCSDSRVPETHILDLLPGELFVHRNIANLLPENDISSRSVVQYAVDILKVPTISLPPPRFSDADVPRGR